MRPLKVMDELGVPATVNRASPFPKNCALTEWESPFTRKVPVKAPVGASVPARSATVPLLVGVEPEGRIKPWKTLLLPAEPVKTALLM